MPTFARRPEVRSHSNRKLYNVLKHYILALEPDGEDIRAEIYKNGGFFNGILSTLSRNAYICETPGGKITFQP